MGEYVDGTTTPASQWSESNREFDYDVLILGAGMSGIYTLYRMTQLGLRTKVLEAGSDAGGTWYWNRYPGARFDSESYTYGYSFSQELLDEWDWSERYAPAHHTLDYTHFVVKKFDLRKHMQFNTTIKSMHYQETTRSWLLTDKNGGQYTSRFLVPCMGVLNQYTLPNIPGVNDFKGLSCHTARWPQQGVNFSNKRVGIIGTGATGIQTIQEVVKDVGHLTVLQRTPNWSAPLGNHPLSKEQMKDIRSRYPDIFAICATTFYNFEHPACIDARKTADVPKEEREAYWELLYSKPGFAKVLSNYHDQGYDKEANAIYSEWMAKKIRQRVNDPETAELLIPKDHGFGTKRTPLETNYFECYNQPNVRLKDIRSDPIERITEKGIKTRDEDMEFDMIIYATGFDAITGAYTSMDIQGVGGVQLRDLWTEGPRTFLGLFVEHFPNMMMVMGPHQSFGNFVRSLEYSGKFAADFIDHCRTNNITYAAATPEGVASWTEHVHDCAKGLLSCEVDSWMTGVNKNLAHKQKRVIARYNGPAPGYRKKCEEVKARNYEDLTMA